MAENKSETVTQETYSIGIKVYSLTVDPWYRNMKVNLTINESIPLVCDFDFYCKLKEKFNNDDLTLQVKIK